MHSEQPFLKPLLPRFLRFLCYLTIFGSIYMLLSSISGLFQPAEISQSLSKSIDIWQPFLQQTMMKDPASEQKLVEIMSDLNAANTTRNMRDHSFFILISNLLTLIGAWFMLRLKRKGFHFYLLGNLIGIIAPLLVFGSNNFLGISHATFTTAIGGLFTLLYALKIKYMQ